MVGRSYRSHMNLLGVGWCEGAWKGGAEGRVEGGPGLSMPPGGC